MKKTKDVEFCKKGQERTLAKFRLWNKQVDFCSSYNYLGVTFDEFLTFEENCETLTKAGHPFAFFAKFKALENMEYDTYTKCFQTSIWPVIAYRAEIWGS